jgi:hypothetical protein
MENLKISFDRARANYQTDSQHFLTARAMRKSPGNNERKPSAGVQKHQEKPNIAQIDPVPD